jgi:hypothetical protein
VFSSFTPAQPRTLFFSCLDIPAIPAVRGCLKQEVVAEEGLCGAPGHRGSPLLPIPPLSHSHSFRIMAPLWGRGRERRENTAGFDAWEGKTAFPAPSSGWNPQRPSHRREPVEPDSIWSLSRLTCMHPCARRYPILPRLHYVGGATLCGYVSAGAVAHRSKVKILGSAPGGEKSGETGALADWVWVIVGWSSEVGAIRSL